MKTKKELDKSIGELTSSEITRMRFIVRELEGLIDNKKINEDNYRRANNILSEIRSIRELYVDRLIQLYNLKWELFFYRFHPCCVWYFDPTIVWFSIIDAAQ